MDFNKEINKKDPKLEIGYHVRISKYKKIFVKASTRNWLEKFSEA